jgi:hypothetical protein
MKDNKDTDKLKNFRMKVDKNTDMFGKPQEIPMAKDAVDIKSPIMGTTYGMDEVSEDFKPSDQTTTGRVAEQVGQGIKYVGKKALEGMSNAVEGF